MTSEGRVPSWRCEQHPDLTPGERFPSDGGGPYCLACTPHERCHEWAADAYDHGWADRGVDARHDAVQAFLLGVAVTSALFALEGVLGAFS